MNVPSLATLDPPTQVVASSPRPTKRARVTAAPLFPANPIPDVATLENLSVAVEAECKAPARNLQVVDVLLKNAIDNTRRVVEAATPPNIDTTMFLWTLEYEIGFGDGRVVGTYYKYPQWMSELKLELIDLDHVSATRCRGFPNKAIKVLAAFARAQLEDPDAALRRCDGDDPEWDQRFDGWAGVCAFRQLLIERVEHMADCDGCCYDGYGACAMEGEEEEEAEEEDSD